MIEIAKKLAFSSVGLVAFVLEKMQETIDEMVNNDRISAEEGEKIIHALMRDASSIREEVQFQLTSNFEKVFQQFASKKEDHLEDLMKRLEYLEKQQSKK